MFFNPDLLPGHVPLFAAMPGGLPLPGSGAGEMLEEPGQGCFSLT